MSKRLKDNLKRKASAWAGQLTRLAKSLAPNHVQPAISSKVEAKDDGTFTIRITADRKIAPDARAQEFGSGIHARRGPKQKYVIEPKTKRFLAFFWDKAEGIVADDKAMGKLPKLKFLPDGRVVFKYVMHPGIEAANEGAGYIRPAMRELRKRAKAELDVAVKDAIMGDLRESFGKKAR